MSDKPDRDPDILDYGVATELIFDEDEPKLHEEDRPVHDKERSLDRTFSAPLQEEEELYESPFYAKQALVAFVINFGHLLLGPATVPLWNWAFRSATVQNMLIRCNPVYFLFEFSQWIWVLAAVCLGLQGRAEYILPSIVTAGTTVVLRGLLVTLKYGFFTKKQWHKFTHEVQSVEELQSRLLLRVWVQVPDDIAEKEIRRAFKRLDIDPDSSKLLFVVTAAADDSDRSYFRFSLKCLAQHMVEQARAAVKPRELTLVRLASMLYAAAPVLVIYLKTQGLALTWAEWLFVAYSMGIAMFTANVFTTLTIVAVYDFSRRKLLQNFCTHLLATAGDAFANSAEYCLYLGDSGSVLAWYHLRMALLDFGKRLTNRLLLYVSLILPLCIATILLTYLMVFGVVGQELIFLMTPALCLIVVELAIFLYIVSAAISLNDQFAIHRDLFLSHILQFAAARDEELQPAIDSMWVVIEKLYQDEAIKPVKLLGFNIDSSVYSQLLAIVAAAVYALYEMLFGLP